MPERFDLLVRAATLVDHSAEPVTIDIAVQDGKIAQIGDLAGAEAETTIQAQGLHLLPGAIDTQVHFREPGLTHKEDLESGTRAAIAGGVTTIFEMPNTDPATTTQEALEDKLDRANGRAWCDYAFFIGGSPTNTHDLLRLESLPGVPGVKVFMGSSTGSLLVEDDDTLRQVMLHGRRPMPVHSEDEPRLRQRKSELPENPHVRLHPWARDPECAVRSTRRLIALAAETRRPTHILHISTHEELPLIAEAKAQGIPVTCEATPQHLTLDATMYETLGSKLQMNPPIREKTTQDALWKAVQEGLFDVFGSDHAPHTLEEKARPYPASPSGMPGVQTIYPILVHHALEGKLPLSQVVKMLAVRPAELYGLKGKGHIAPGYDADFVLFDLAATQEVTPAWLQSKCGWSPYEGWTLRGKITHVSLRGHLAVHDSTLASQRTGAMAQFDWK